MYRVNRRGASTFLAPSPLRPKDFKLSAWLKCRKPRGGGGDSHTTASSSSLSVSALCRIDCPWQESKQFCTAKLNDLPCFFHSWGLRSISVAIIKSSWKCHLIQRACTTPAQCHKCCVFMLENSKILLNYCYLSLLFFSTALLNSSFSIFIGLPPTRWLGHSVSFLIRAAREVEIINRAVLFLGNICIDVLEALSDVCACFHASGRAGAGAQLQKTCSQHYIQHMLQGCKTSRLNWIH